jgi:hypothetical protein
MYGDDPRDLGMGPQWVDDPREARAKSDEEDAVDTNRPRMTLYNEYSYEE